MGDGEETEEVRDGRWSGRCNMPAKVEPPPPQDVSSCTKSLTSTDATQVTQALNSLTAFDSKSFPKVGPITHACTSSAVVAAFISTSCTSQHLPPSRTPGHTSALTGCGQGRGPHQRPGPAAVMCGPCSPGPGRQALSSCRHLPGAL